MNRIQFSVHVSQSVRSLALPAQQSATFRAERNAGREGGAYWVHQTCVLSTRRASRVFGARTTLKSDHFKKLSAHERIILKWILK